MKKILTLLMVILISGFISCAKKVAIVNKPAQKAPPGQVKKATGSQSAAPCAPGQQKNTSAPQKKKN